MSNKIVTPAHLLDKQSGYCIKLNRNGLPLSSGLYSEIYISRCDEISATKTDFNDFNIGALYFRKTNDTIFYLSFDKMKYDSNWVYSTVPNKLEEQVAYTSSDTIGFIRHLAINNFRTANLTLTSIAHNDSTVLYDFSLNYTKHPSHLGALESFQIISDGHIKNITFRLDNGSKYTFK